MPINPFGASAMVILLLSWGSCHQRNAEKPSIISSDIDSTGPIAAPASFVSCSGTLVIPSSDIISVSLPSPGILKSVFVTTGRYVKKGDILGTLENIEFLKIQEQYLEAKSDFYYFGEDLKRQGGLAIENATSVKKMQQAQRDYQTSEIRYRSLEKQLALIGFNTDSLDADHLLSDIAIRSPESGYIDKIAVREGTHISAGEILFVIIRKYAPLIAFDLPEKIYPQVQTGNEIEFYFPGDSLEIHKARLTFINRQTDPSSHLFRALAIPFKSAPGLIPGMQVRLRLPLPSSPVGM